MQHYKKRASYVFSVNFAKFFGIAFFITCERMLPSDELAHFKIDNQLNSYIEFPSRIFVLLFSGLVIKELLM